MTTDSKRRDAELRAIIKPIPGHVYAADIRVNRLTAILQEQAADYGSVERNPDFQRGHVWTPEQQTAYVEAYLRGALGEELRTITWNCPQFAGPAVEDRAPSDLPQGFQCLDGLQRLTALEAWIKGDVQPFGLTLDDLQGTAFDPHRMSYMIRFSVFAFQTRAEVLDYYLAINSGGTVHSQEELDRVRKLRESVTA